MKYYERYFDCVLKWKITYDGSWWKRSPKEEDFYFFADVVFLQFLTTVLVLLLAASYQECRRWLTGQRNMSTKVWRETSSSIFRNFPLFHCRFLYFTCLVLIKFMNAPFFRQNETKLLNSEAYFWVIIIITLPSLRSLFQGQFISVVGCKLPRMP